MSERRILLAVSTTRYSQALVSHAMDEAARLQGQGHSVHIDVLYVIESDELERIGKMVGDEGFLGLSPQEDVLEALGAEHHRTATRRIEQVQAAASERGIAVHTLEEQGHFAAEVIAQAEQHDYEVILVTRADRPFISRFLFGSEADRVSRLARKEGLGRVIIDEES